MMVQLPANVAFPTNDGARIFLTLYILAISLLSRSLRYPLVAVLGFVLCLVACIGLAFDPSQRIALWCGIPFVAVCYGAYYLTRLRKLTQEPQHVAE